MLPRLIDRARASLPGGNLGDYVPLDAGLSGMLLGRLSIAPADFVAAVERADSDEGVVSWLHERVAPSDVAAACARLAEFKTREISPEHRPFVEKLYAPLRIDDYETAFDLLDADDHVSFAKAGT